jgi:hypothetical protein
MIRSALVVLALTSSQPLPAGPTAYVAVNDFLAPGASEKLELERMQLDTCPPREQVIVPDLLVAETFSI